MTESTAASTGSPTKAVRSPNPPRSPATSIEELLELLKDPEDRVRYRARVELGARDTTQVIAALKIWVANLDKSSPDYEHNLTEALWAHQYQDVVNPELLDRVLASPDSHARAAATRVLCVWRDRVPKALDTLKKLAADPYPRVRLEAIRAASFFTVPEAVEVPLISADHPSDEYLDYTRGETMKTLEPYWRKAVAEGKSVAVSSDAGTRFFLSRISIDELLKMKRSRAIDLELLVRKGVREEVRREALADMAKFDKKPELKVLLEAINALDERRNEANDAVAFDLGRLLTSRDSAELTTARPELEGFATAGQMPITRQLGYLALIAADRGVDKAWMLASKSAGSLRDLVDAMPAIRDPGQRLALYPKVLPAPHRAAQGAGRRCLGVIKGDRGTIRADRADGPSNADARRGRGLERRPECRPARQGHAEEHRLMAAAPSAAIDGNKSGVYGDGGQTHTRENTPDPWWQVDLGAEMPIESVAIWNRTEGNFYKRLDPFTIKVLDADRNVVFQADNLPAQREMATIKIGGNGLEGAVRRSAMVALTSVRGKEAETFKALAKFVRSEGSDRTASIRAISRIPIADWPADEAGSTLDALLAYIKTIPPRDRTSANALDAIQLGDSLAGLLPLTGPRRPAEALGRPGRPGDPAGHDHRPDAVRQGSDRRPGRQAGRDRLRERRHHAAQLRRDQARLTRRGRPARRVLEHAAGSPGAELRATLRQDPRRQPVARPSRLAEAELHRADQAGCLSLCLHVSRPLAADVRSVLRRRRTSPPTSPTRPATWPPTLCRSSTTCSRTTARARSGRSTISPRRSKV